MARWWRPPGALIGGIVAEDGAITHTGATDVSDIRRLLDARGNWVRPGVIEPHTYIGVGATWERSTTRAATRT